jgi:hypothetical protein
LLAGCKLNIASLFSLGKKISTSSRF